MPSGTVIHYYGAPKEAHPRVTFNSGDMIFLKERAKNPLSQTNATFRKKINVTQRFYLIKAEMATARLLAGLFDENGVELPDHRTAVCIWSDKPKVDLMCRIPTTDLVIAVWPEGETTCESCAVIVYGWVGKERLLREGRPTEAAGANRLQFPWKKLRPMNEIYLPDKAPKQEVEQESLFGE